MNSMSESKSERQNLYYEQAEYPSYNYNSIQNENYYYRPVNASCYSIIYKKAKDCYKIVKDALVEFSEYLHDIQF